MEKEVPSPNAAERVQNKVQCCNEEHVPGEDSPPMEEKSEESEADVINRGDCKKETIKKEKLATTEGTASDESRVTTNEPSELTSQIPNDKANDQGDEPEPELKKNISATNKSDKEFGDEERRQEPESPTQQLDDHSNNVENIGPTTPEASDTSQTTTQGASETSVPPTQDKQDDRIDGGKSEKKEISAKDNTDCQPGDQFSEGETQSTNTNEDGSCENLDSDQAHFQEHAVTAATALPSQPADFSDTIQDRDSSKKEVRPVAEAHFPDKDSTQTEKKSNPSQTDGKQLLSKNEKKVTIAPKSDESRVTTNKPSELTLQIPNDKANDQGDEPEPELKKNISATNKSDNEFGDASEERRQEPESPTQQLDDHSNNVENIGPTTPEASQTEDPQVTSGSGKYLLAVAIVVAIVAIALHFLQPESPPQTNDVRHIDVFLKQLEKVKTRFPNQRAELWNRGRIHLKRHLQTTQPTEPVSLILTAGLRAEKTLNCLARDLASAYSSALNASVLHIDGASKASQDSDHVKLDIDRKLQGAFDGDKPVAVIHRFEELPPGSTLIFYRYCDHENAAFKNTFLIFTVLLGEEDEIPAKISLCAVEEMVDDHLQKKFLTHGHPVSFDMMDLDKYGGLWSRISHLILPVAAEQRIELEGC
ncbi:torsin-1A-interacting protein 2-like isoform X2 [Simochromis diagramma]|uniref:torsin-1A-interacting protein 2-like isoform X2 n=1 Tax=Simochromis diagramma TaxID=43689 RepID=UPI001A7F0D38|nr:torsin-1A-interacting protein 2-like isoform X2 [Simochromis diagramma]